jgi:hypothetical protein
MGHVFVYPVVKELRSENVPAPATPARPPAQRATQRNLVQASLLRRPAAEPAQGRRS